jgi:LmbE family N-acetylglucosaminyl deacetylase/CheY-like chemotaxis protein
VRVSVDRPDFGAEVTARRIASIERGWTVMRDPEVDAPFAEQDDILLVEDDLRHASEVAALLGEHASVVSCPSAEEALDVLPSRSWELIIAQVELPGMSGLEFIARIRKDRRKVACLMMSAEPSFEYAVGALRIGADDYVTTPCEPAELVAKVHTLIAATHRRRARSREIVLAIGAHPDDVEIGTGGILLSHVAMRHEVTILTLTGGEQGGTVLTRAAEAHRAAELLGARLVQTDLTDTSVSPGAQTIAAIKQIVDAIDPTTVYTHTISDVHQDHRNVHNASLVASRGVRRVYCYQSPSTTVDFRPTRFIAIDDRIDQKLELIAEYGSQAAIRHYLEPELLRSTSRYWSRFTTSRYVEPLEVVRESIPAADVPREARQLELSRETSQVPPKVSGPDAE